eukprot:1508274-Rhodomonas_salina.4
MFSNASSRPRGRFCDQQQPDQTTSHANRHGHVSLVCICVMPLTCRVEAATLAQMLRRVLYEYTSGLRPCPPSQPLSRTPHGQNQPIPWRETRWEGREKVEKDGVVWFGVSVGRR